ncbi:MAG: late promoter transcription accessory protein [Candidatus Pacebacteria bacterium]|nr:late promoter transcription accessory protein [Candidatus Paceibacterota bacterium]
MSKYLTQFEFERIEAETALKRKMWTPEKFVNVIEGYAKKHDYSILEAVLEYCKEKDLDVEFVGKELLSPRLESKLQDDAESKRLIEKTNRLQFV